MKSKSILKEHGIAPIPEHQLEIRYCEMLDDIYGETKIGPYEYSTSKALAEVDPAAFNCGFSDWLSSEIGETLEEIDGEYFDKHEIDSIDEEGTK